MKSNLVEVTPVRFFKGDKKRRLLFVRRYPGMWDNDTHFIRAAVQHFMHRLSRNDVVALETRELKKSVKIRRGDV